MKKINYHHVFSLFFVIISFWLLLHSDLILGGLSLAVAYFLFVEGKMQ